jgi:glutamine amidotransferase
MEKTVIVDYGSGNLRSAGKAFERAAKGQRSRHEVLVSGRTADVATADRLVVPGVGAFADCYAGLAAIDGMLDAVAETATTRGRPFFGICVGMQLMAERGLEHGVHKGFGWIKGDIAPIEPADPQLKIPHMGWNTLRLKGAHPVFDGLAQPADGSDEGPHVYFVHSYGLQASDPADISAETDYGGPLVAAVARETMVGTQFHPEKSQGAGLRIIENFLGWRP